LDNLDFEAYIIAQGYENEIITLLNEFEKHPDFIGSYITKYHGQPKGQTKKTP
jgi:hypothetical protein